MAKRRKAATLGVVMTVTLGTTINAIEGVGAVVHNSSQFESVGQDPPDLVYVAATRDTYVLSPAEGVVRRFDKDGIEAEVITLRGVNNPRGIDVDDERNLYVADTGNHRVIALLSATGYGPDEAISADGSFGGIGGGNGQFQSPEDVGVGVADGEVKIFVSDTGNNRIQRFNRAGVFELSFDGSDAVLGPLSSPRGIEVTATRAVLVVDGGNDVVRIFDGAGSSIGALGSPGSGPGQLHGPMRVSVHPSEGVLVISDTDNDRVQWFAPTGELERSIPISGVSPAAAVVDTGELGDRLLVAPTNGNGLVVIPIVIDPPGATPLDVVAAFLDKLAVQDIAGARHFVSADRQDLLAELEENPATRARAAQNAANTTDLQIKKYRSNVSRVTGRLDAGTETVDVIFVLGRDPSLGVWLIRSF